MATVLGRILLGTRKNDAIAAAAPGDFLIGGPGTDYLVASTGADVFGYNPGDGQDWIDGFTPGVDKIQFSPAVNKYNVFVKPETIVGVDGLAV
jgi:Ca2+-binding RTX toxin-like protein